MSREMTQDQDEIDKLLFRGISEGDEHAFKLLFKFYYSALCNSIMSIVKNRMVAEEIVGDLFFKIWEKRETIEIQTSVRGYLFYAVRNLSLNWLKAHKKQNVGLEDVNTILVSKEAGPLDKIIMKEMLEEWEVKISKLPSQRQKVFRMNKIEGKPYKEIARRLSLSEKTVRNHVQLAMRTLSSLCVSVYGYFFL